MRWKEALVLCSLAVVISLVVVCASQLQAWLAPRASSPLPESAVVEGLQPSPVAQPTVPAGEDEVPAAPLTSLNAGGDAEQTPGVTAGPAAEPSLATEPSGRSPDAEPQASAPTAAATPTRAAAEAPTPSSPAPRAETTRANETGAQSPATPRAPRPTGTRDANPDTANSASDRIGRAAAGSVTVRPGVSATAPSAPPALTLTPQDLAGPEALPTTGRPLPTSTPGTAAATRQAEGVRPAPSVAQTGPARRSAPAPQASSQREGSSAAAAGNRPAAAAPQTAAPARPAPSAQPTANATPPAPPEIAPQDGGTPGGAPQEVEPGSPAEVAETPELEPQGRAPQPDTPQDVAPAAPVSPLARGRELTTLLYRGQLRQLWDTFLPSARAPWSGFAAFRADLSGREAAYGPESRLLDEAVGEEDGGAVYTRTVTFQGGKGEPWAVTFHLDGDGEVRDFQIGPSGESR